MNVILSSIVTEKTVEDMKKGKYAFRVAIDSDKTLIKKSVEKYFNVNVIKITTINVKKRTKQTMQKRTIKIPAWKKAMVEVKAGQKIDVFNVGGKK